MMTICTVDSYMYFIGNCSYSYIIALDRERKNCLVFSIKLSGSPAILTVVSVARAVMRREA